MDSKQYIKQLLTSDPKGAIDRLLLLINQSHNTKLIKEHEHNLILNQGRYLGAESEYKSGLISRELFYTERQNVVNSILGVIDSLPKDLFVAKNAEFDILQQADLTFNETIDKVVKYSNASAFEYDIFFSFSSKDKIQAKLIVDELRGIGFKVFFSDEDLKKYVGLSFVDKIGFALQNSSHFIWHCTPNSAKSPWVKNEFGIFYTQIHMQSPQERQFFILEGEGFLESDIPLFYLNIQRSNNINDIINSVTSSINLELGRKEKAPNKSKDQVDINLSEKSQPEISARLSIKPETEDSPKQKISNKPSLTTSSKDNSDFADAPKTDRDLDRKIKRILDSLKRERCVIVVGPDILKIDGQTVQSLLLRYIIENHADIVKYYNEKEGVFVIKNHYYKSDLQRAISLFYDMHSQNNSVDESILLNLVRIPTPILFSLNPDNSLSTIASKYLIKHRFAYLTHSESGIDSDPTADDPVFYNLCGSIERDDSLLLDYDDWFRWLRLLICLPQLPRHLRALLERANTLLLVGFDFEKRHSKLLIQVLSGQKNFQVISIGAKPTDHETNLFLSLEFNIEFIEDEATFWNEFMSRAEEEGILREIVTNQTPTATRLRILIEKGDISGALKYLKENSIGDSDYITLLSSWYNSYTLSKKTGTEDTRYLDTQYNKVINGILEIVKEIQS